MEKDTQSFLQIISIHNNITIKESMQKLDYCFEKVANDMGINIKDVIKQFNVYKILDSDMDFYDWYSRLRDITIDNDKLNNINNMFCVDTNACVHKSDCSLKKYTTIETFLRPYGFVFA